MNPIGNEGRLDANIAIEVLSLEASPNKDQLNLIELVQTDADASNYHTELVRRNLFAKGFAKALNDIKLKAITFNRLGIAEAWFTIDRLGTVKTIGAGQQIPVALHAIAVVEVLADKVLVRVNQDPYWIMLGQTIGEVCAPVTEVNLGAKL